VGGETYSEIFLGVLLEAAPGLDSKKQLIYESPIPPIVVPIFNGKDIESYLQGLYLRNAIWMLEAGEGEKRGRGPNK
jgi:hypothetical protein